MYAADSQHELIVVLRNCYIGDISLKYLMRGIMYAERSTLTSSTTVQSGNTCRLALRLQHNNIHSSGAHSIAEALKGCNLISKLILSDNSVEEDGLRNIAEALMSNSPLVQLDLSCCSIQITDHSGPVVTEMLQKNKSLQKLKLLQNTQLSDHDCGALYITEGLKQNSIINYH